MNNTSSWKSSLPPWCVFCQMTSAHMQKLFHCIPPEHLQDTTQNSLKQWFKGLLYLSWYLRKGWAGSFSFVEYMPLVCKHTDKNKSVTSPLTIFWAQALYTCSCVVLDWNTLSNMYGLPWKKRRKEWVTSIVTKQKPLLCKYCVKIVPRTSNCVFHWWASIFSDMFAFIWEWQ